MVSTLLFKLALTILREKDRCSASKPNSKKLSRCIKNWFHNRHLLFSTPFKTKSEEWQTDIFGEKEIFYYDLKDPDVLILDGLTFSSLVNVPNRKVINVFQPDFCRFVEIT